MSDDLSYMVFTEDGQRHGPLPKHRVLELLERGFISESAEVEHASAGRAQLPLHPHFAGFFIEGDSRNEKLQRNLAVRDQRRRKMRGRRRLRRFGRIVVWLSVIGGCAGVALYWDELAQRVGKYWPSDAEENAHGPQHRASSAVADQASLLESRREVLLSSGMTAPPEDDVLTPVEHVEKAWRRMVAAGLKADAQTLAHMESAVWKSTGEPWALTGLIASGVWAQNPVTADGAQSAKMALAMLDEFDSPGDLAFAQSIVALTEGQYEDSLSAALKCLEVTRGHAECSLLATVSAGRAGRSPAEIADVLDTAKNSYPDSVNLLVWEQWLAFERGEVLAVKAVLDGLGARAHVVPVYFGLNAAIEERLGNWQAARRGYQTHFQLEPRAVESGIKAAILLYQVEGQHQKARELLQRLSKSEVASPGQLSRIALHGSHAARIAGDLDDALELAGHTSSSVRQERYLALAQAMAYAAKGDQKAVDAKVVAINQGGFEGRDSARYHAWLAKYYLGSGRVQLALWALQAALAEDPNWGVLSSLAIEIDLQVGNLSSLPKRLEEAVSKDLAQDALREPFSNIPHLGGQDAGFLRDIQSTLKTNVYYADTVDLVTGVWLLTGCELLRECAGAEQYLLRAKTGAKQAAVAQLGLLHLYSAQEEWDKARNILEALRPSRGLTAAYTAFQGEVLFSEGKLQAALDSYKQVGRLLPKSTWGPRGLVGVYRALGDRRGMRAALATVRKLDPNDSVTGALSLREGVAR